MPSWVPEVRALLSRNLGPQNMSFLLEAHLTSPDRQFPSGQNSQKSSDGHILEDCASPSSESRWVSLTCIGRALLRFGATWE